MGWLFGRKKKKIPASSALHDDQSLSFGSNSGSDTVIKPDQFKAAAGLGAGFPDMSGQSSDLGSLSNSNGFDDVDDDDNDAWGQLGSQNSNDRSAPVAPPRMLSPDMELPNGPRPATGVGRRLTQDYKYLQVQQYKRILGELGDLETELTHMGNLSKSLDKAEYNEEKHFLRLKETMRKAHDKVLQSDRILFSHNG